MKTYVEDITPQSGEITSFFVVDNITLRKTKKGGDYWTLTLKDKTGSIGAKIWGAAAFVDAIETVRSGQFVKVNAITGSYDGKTDLTVNKIRITAPKDFIVPASTDPEDLPPDAPSLDDFLPVGTKDRFRQMDDLAAFVDCHVDHRSLHALCHQVFATPALHMAFRDAPAATGNHHAFIGGLIEHSFSMSKVALSLCQHYEINPSLLITACIFHDIGKCRELEWNPVIQYTQEGQLVGHVVMGLELLDRLRVIFSEAVIKEGMLMEEYEAEFRVFDHLRHLVASHHGNLEWGAAKLPASREAVLFHLIDMIDSRMGGFDLLEREQTNQGGFTNFQKIVGTAAWFPEKAQ